METSAPSRGRRTAAAARPRLQLPGGPHGAGASRCQERGAPAQCRGAAQRRRRGEADAARDPGRSSDTARGHSDNVLWDALGKVPFVGNDVEAVQVMARALEEASHGASEPANALLAQAQGDRLRDADGRSTCLPSPRSPRPCEKMSAALDGAAEAGRPARPRRAHRPPGQRHPQRAGPDRRAAPRRRGAEPRWPACCRRCWARTARATTCSSCRTTRRSVRPAASRGRCRSSRADNGKLTLGEQRSVDDFDVLTQPALPLTEEEKALYGDNLGENIRDTNLTPDFPRAAALMSALHTRSFGSDVDGVVAIDPVVLASVLKATGPVTVAGRRSPPATSSPSSSTTSTCASRPASSRTLYFDAVARGIFDTLVTRQVEPLKVLRRARQVGRPATVPGVERAPGGGARARRRRRAVAGSRATPARFRRSGSTSTTRRPPRSSTTSTTRPTSARRAAPPRVPRPSRSAWCSARRPRGAGSSSRSYITGDGPLRRQGLHADEPAALRAHRRRDHRADRQRPSRSGSWPASTTGARSRS